MKNGNTVCECKFDFEDEIIKPEFIGKYYRTYTEYGEVYYSDEM